MLDLLKRSKNSVFLETNRFDTENKKSLLFLNPKKVIICYSLDELEEKLKDLDKATDEGYYLAGFISYEAGYGFEDSLKGNKRYSFPLLWFGVYEKPLIYSYLNSKSPLEEKYTIKNIKPNLSKNKYLKDIEKIKQYIREGQTYQVNFTFKYKFLFSGSAFQLYKDLRKQQSVSYSALIKFNDYFILSFSPELFFRKKLNLIETRPMKGTIKRGRNLVEDSQYIKKLKNSIKDRSENVMIVDLLRNDLGRISETGTVKTKRLFKIEGYETLFQMISIIKGRLKKNISFLEIFKNIFPCGSVTGAPKIRTMQIIKELEREPRKIYTGSIGYITPRKKSVFNVAIRTLIIDKKKRRGEMGIGSGVVYDSKAQSEYSECLLKAKFLTSRRADFDLIESILYAPKKGYFLLKLHLKRLKNSSKYFNFCYNEKDIRKKLSKLSRIFKNKKGYYKVRLLLSKNGRIALSYSQIKRSKRTDVKKVKFSDKKTLSDNLFLYHKTTNRKLYDKEYKGCKKNNFYDLIFANEKNQITEGAISNVIIKKAKSYYTPPIECGLLDGVYRQFLINKINFPLKEKILYKRDIIEADKIYMCNSVRGLQEVELI